jgi:primosomal protein N' (replication factor Y)
MGVVPANPPDVDRLSVLLPLPLPGPLDYLPPPGVDPRALSAGTLVEAPLGSRQVVGVVREALAGGDLPRARLKPVAPIDGAPRMPAVGLAFVDWVAAYTLSAPGAVLRMCLPARDGLIPPGPVKLWGLGHSGGERRSPGRARVMALLADGRAIDGVALAREAGVAPAVLRAMAKGGLIVPVAAAAPGPVRPDPDLPGPALSSDQGAAAARLAAGLGQGFSVTHLAGVTGSGKTEVYFEAIAAMLRADATAQALVLLPEIALSEQWFQRFERRFGAPPVVWHSELAGGRRHRAWHHVADGRARVVVGARSALFLPFSDLRLVVVDEEHDGAFKQEDGVTYHARDMAVARARLGQLPAILVSATPSLETEVNVRRGRYARVNLPARHGGATLPGIELVDLRRAPPAPGRFVAPPLIDAVAATLAAGDQAMLFLNRRGFAPLTLCRACGHRYKCDQCDAWLVDHRLRRRLVCHHCGHQEPAPVACRNCGATDALIACGPGVERVAEEARALFPDVRVALAASDLIVGADAARDLVRRMERREIDLLVGTQLIAKGFHFPALALVGVVDADLGLAGGDLRAGERTWQLLNQVAGRAGRADRPGRVLLQTAEPSHPVLAALASGDHDRFLAAEAAEREAFGMPPFGRLVALIVSSADGAAADRVARDLARLAPRDADVTVLGPAPAPIALLRGRHRRRLLLKAARGVSVQPIVRAWLDRLPARHGPPVRVAVDVDPYGFM